MLHVICCMKWVRNSCCIKRLPNTVWWGQWSPETPLAELFYTYLLNCLFNWWTQVQQILWPGAPPGHNWEATKKCCITICTTRQQNILKTFCASTESADLIVQTITNKYPSRETLSFPHLGCAQRAPTRSAGVRRDARCSPASAPSAARETSPAPATPPHAPEILPLINPFLGIDV